MIFALPLYDDNPTNRVPVATWFLIGSCIGVFWWQLGHDQRQVFLSFGMIPAVLFGSAELAPALRVVPPWATLLTSMFLHAGWFHLIGNMVFLWIFGNNVEDALGRGRYLVLYLGSGVAAALCQALSDRADEVPMVGASGAIAGVLGAYLLLYPWSQVHVFLWIVIFFRIVTVPAWILLGLWFAMQLASGLTRPAGGPGVAFWAHVARLCQRPGPGCAAAAARNEVVASATRSRLRGDPPERLHRPPLLSPRLGPRHRPPLCGAARPLGLRSEFVAASSSCLGDCLRWRPDDTARMGHCAAFCGSASACWGKQRKPALDPFAVRAKIVSAVARAAVEGDARTVATERDEFYRDDVRETEHRGVSDISGSAVLRVLRHLDQTRLGGDHPAPCLAQIRPRHRENRARAGFADATIARRAGEKAWLRQRRAQLRRSRPARPAAADPEPCCSCTRAARGRAPPIRRRTPPSQSIERRAFATARCWHSRHYVIGRVRAAAFGSGKRARAIG